MRLITAFSRSFLLPGADMTTQLITYTEAMSQDRFKQEVALIVVDRMMQAVGEQIRARFSDVTIDGLTKSLQQFEQSRPKIMGRVAESIADAVAAALGPVHLPEGAR